MEVKHFSHRHPLTLVTKQLYVSGKQVFCYGCEESIISGRIYYSCESCDDFFLHRKCLELPKEIMRPLHHKHPLSLHLVESLPLCGRRFCDLCKKTCMGFVYHCRLCNFDLDIQCAFPPCNIEGMEVEHVSHPHLLTLNTAEQLKTYRGQAICYGCEEAIKDRSVYICKSSSCYDDFFLHKKCFELPLEIKHLLHPQHPLFLSATASWIYTYRPICRSCNKANKQFFYICFLCSFCLDIGCAFPPCISEGEDRPEHQFTCPLSLTLLKSLSFICNACGTDGDDCPWVCSICQLMVHKRCISLPHTIKTEYHHHPRLIHTYCLEDCESVNQYCGFCRLQVDTNYGCYYCPDCDFVAHASCGTKDWVLESECEEGEKNEEVLSINTNDGFMESAFTVVREIKHGEEEVFEEIKHFSHQHNLILMDKVFDDCLKCDGCVLPISTPFYGCVECNFFLDKTCIELPMRKTWQYHRHPLTLFAVGGEHHLFCCSSCGKICSGFRYTCNGCEYEVDVRCLGLLKESIQHEGHEHPLFLTLKPVRYPFCTVQEKDQYYSCCGDNDGGYSVFFKCIKHCGFKLHIQCANLPQKVRHKYDEHPLFLTYVDPNTYQFVCQICEKGRDSKLWFYRCEDCDFDAHPQCALGKYPFVKLGIAHTYGFHPHPLALVEKTEDYDHPACHTCGDRCENLALECTDSQCNFIVHGKGGYCTDHRVQLVRGAALAPKGWPSIPAPFVENVDSYLTTLELHPVNLLTPLRKKIG